MVIIKSCVLKYDITSICNENINLISVSFIRSDNQTIQKIEHWFKAVCD